MPDTYISKKIKKILSDISVKVNRPLADIKRLSYNLDKAAKKGTLTKTDLDDAMGQLGDIRKLTDAIDISPIENVLNTTKTTVTTVKAGKTAALNFQVGTSGPLAPQQIAIAKAEKLIESAETALEVGDVSLDVIVEDSKETTNTIEKTVEDIGTYEKYLAENKDLKEKEFQGEWDRLVANTLAHTFYGAEGEEGKLKRDWVEEDPEKYKLVLDHAEIHGVPISSIHPLSHMFAEGSYYWGLKQRVESEVALYDIAKKWIKDKCRWWELNKIVNDRMVQINNAGFGTEELDRLRALNTTDLDEMDVMKGNISSYKSDYKAWESVLLTLFETNPGVKAISPGLGSKIVSGRITAEEYNLEVSPKLKDLLDKSVGTLSDLVLKKDNPGIVHHIEYATNVPVTGANYEGSDGREVHIYSKDDGIELVTFIYRYGTDKENVK